MRQPDISFAHKTSLILGRACGREEGNCHMKEGTVGKQERVSLQCDNNVQVWGNLSNDAGVICNVYYHKNYHMFAIKNLTKPMTFGLNLSSH